MDRLADNVATSPAPAAELPRPGAVVVIDPHDLPAPPDGWIDLVLDDDPPAPRPPAADEPARAIAPTPPAPPPSAPAGSEGAERSRARRREGTPWTRRWLLVPEALVVAGFVLVGAFVAGAVRLARAPEPATAGSAEVEAPAHAARSARAAPHGSRGPGAPSLAAPGAKGPAAAPALSDGATPDAGEPPAAGEVPVEPEPPPAPSVAPWPAGG